MYKVVYEIVCLVGGRIIIGFYKNALGLFSVLNFYILERNIICLVRGLYLFIKMGKFV